MKEFMLDSFLQLRAAPVSLGQHCVSAVRAWGLCKHQEAALTWVRGRVSQDGSDAFPAQSHGALGPASRLEWLEGFEEWVTVE